MIKNNLVKRLVKKHNKKIGKGALKKIDFLAENQIEKLIEKASRKADISGRIILKEKDFD